MQQQFEDAKHRLNTLSEDPGNDVKLQLYALFKQATVGKCNAKKPGMFDMVGKAKWDAWNSLGDLSQNNAQQKYIEIVNKLAGTASQTGLPVQANNKRPANVSSYNEVGITIEKNGSVLKIIFDRPHKRNSFTMKGYGAVTKALTDAATDDSVALVVLTGSGQYYSSGNDLNSFAVVPLEGQEYAIEHGSSTLRDFVKSFIMFPKPLIAAVNGPAIGIAVTTLGLCDLVYASDAATFHTPFMDLGISPEGCSSYIFPKLMGYAKANDVLMQGRKLDVHEALDRCLVTEVFPHDSFQKNLKARIDKMTEKPPKALAYLKALVRASELDILLKINDMEINRLFERFSSEECMNAAMKFLQKSSKL